MLALMLPPVEDIPEFRSLVLGIPLPEIIPVRKEALLGPGLLLVTPATSQRRIEAVLPDGVQQGGDLQAVPRGIGSLLLLHAPFIDGLLDRSHNQTRPQLFCKGIAVVDGFPEVVAGVNVHQRKGKAGRPEGLAGQVSHHDGILPAREEQGRILELGRRFPQQKDGFGFELLEVTEVVVRHIALW